MNYYYKDTEWEYKGNDRIRESARAIVFDNEGFYYFSKLDTDDSDRFGKGIYIQTFGGGIEENENIIEALKRELLEELGARVKIIKELGTVYDAYNLVRCNVVSHYYLVKVLSFGKTALTGKEIQFKLSSLKLTYKEALEMYEGCCVYKLGKLLYQREVPILKEAKRFLE